MSENNGARRLPIYLLLDTSGSMCGEPIEACRQGIKALLSDLRGDPQALETAYLSVIAFNDTATQAAPLADLMTFAEPNLQAYGGTNLGLALKSLAATMAREVRQTSKTQKGDWKPLVFLLTDGQPSDAWEAEADALKKARNCNIIACAAGPGADTSVLKRITENVVVLSNLEPDQLKRFFKWVSASVRMQSTALTGNPAATQLPPPPAGLVVVP